MKYIVKILAGTGIVTAAFLVAKLVSALIPFASESIRFFVAAVASAAVAYVVSRYVIFRHDN